MRPRKHTSELPSRLYEAYGKKIYSIAYRRPDGIWDFRLRCNVNDTGEIVQRQLTSPASDNYLGRLI